MSASPTIADYLARGHTAIEALMRWHDARERDSLNELNAAREHAAKVVARGDCPPDLFNTLLTLTHASFDRHRELRKNLAKACAPWFEVEQ